MCSSACSCYDVRGCITLRLNIDICSVQVTVELLYHQTLSRAAEEKEVSSRKALYMCLQVDPVFVYFDATGTTSKRP